MGCADISRVLGSFFGHMNRALGFFQKICATQRCCHLHLRRHRRATGSLHRRAQFFFFKRAAAHWKLSSLLSITWALSGRLPPLTAARLLCKAAERMAGRTLARKSWKKKGGKEGFTGIFFGIGAKTHYCPQ